MIARVSILAVMLCSLTTGGRSSEAGTAPATGGDVVPSQAIACPTYWPPAEQDWESFKSAAPASSIAIVNWEVTTEYTDAFVRDLQSSGLIVIGYVETGYMATGVETAKGSVDDYYAAYPTL